MKKINNLSKKLLLAIFLVLFISQSSFAELANKQPVLAKSQHKTRLVQKKAQKKVQKKPFKHIAIRKQPVSSLAIPDIDEIPPAFTERTIKTSDTMLSNDNPSLEQRIVDFVHKTVTNLQYSSYKFGGTRFDTSRGIYVLDCSSYVDNILQTIYPHAYSNLVNSTGSEKPTSLHFYNFFSRLTDNSKLYWNKIDNIEDLQAGDILVFRDKFSSRARSRGHVMVVMNKIMRDMNTAFVQVADSAPSGHSLDTRLPHVSGIGIGTLLLKANPETGQPFAYAWKIGSSWKENVHIAMARPMEYS